MIGNTFVLSLVLSALLGLITNNVVVSAWMMVPPEPFVHAGIGAIAGGIGATAAYPIDYVKSQLQTKEGRESYKNGIDATIQIVTRSPLGPLALYKGSLVNIIGIVPEKAIKLGMNDFLRVAIASSGNGHLPILGEIFAGGMAGACQVIATNPLEVIKVRLQTSNQTFQEVWMDITQNEKGTLSNLYKGAGACCSRDVIFSAALFPLYAHLKIWVPMMLFTILTIAGGGGTLGGDMTTAPDPSIVEPYMFWCNLLAGSLAAAPAAFIATPSDFIKTRMQQARQQQQQQTEYALPYRNNIVQYSEKVNRKNTYNKLKGGSRTTSVDATSLLFDEKQTLKDYYRNDDDDTMFHVVTTIISTEGAGVLFSGWLERVIRSIPQFGVTLAMFDVLTNAAIQIGLLSSSTAG